MMIEMMTRCVGCTLIAALAVATLASVANAQEIEEPGQDIENVLLTFHLVEADGFADEDPEISDVVSELRQLFSFRGYRLLSTSVFNVGLLPTSRGTSGDGSQRIIPSGSETPLTIMASISSRRSTGAVRATVTLAEVVTQADFFEPRPTPLLEASVTMRDGQSVVLGSARRTPGEPVLILVVTPRIDP